MNFDDVPKPFIFQDDMLFESHFAKTRVNSRLKSYYESLFGENLRVGEEIDVPVGWLTKGSNEKVQVICPRCNKSRAVVFQELMKCGHGFCLFCKKQKSYDAMIGKTFGKLTPLRYGEGSLQTDGTIRTTFICNCSCGNNAEVRADRLKNGNTTSCGCLVVESNSGSNNYFYNPKLTDEQRQKHKEQRRDSETQKVKKLVRQRDKNTCWFCGSHGFIVHHLNDFANHPEERTSVNNLVCVCNKCHNDFHKWSGGTKALTTTLHNYLYKYYIMSLDRTLDK